MFCMAAGKASVWSVPVKEYASIGRAQSSAATITQPP
jgi:hypothetical protein